MASTIKHWIEEVCEVECPSCGAPPNESCDANVSFVSAKSKGLSVHLARWEAWDVRSREPLLIRKMREAIRDEAP